MKNIDGKASGCVCGGNDEANFFWYYIYKHKHWTDFNVIVGTQIHTHALFFNFTITPLFHFQHLIYHHPLSLLLQFQQPNIKKLFFRTPFRFFDRKVELQEGYLYYLYDLSSGFLCSSLAMNWHPLWIVWASSAASMEIERFAPSAVLGFIASCL
ncbi:unnamed protein product [Vicia faba]|uniref:Uncharacterized protein n=1 Tax=Vicia faba TaxID=3906 RepID=A0AAV0YGS3_VICFA|nr:unnamed protein product [Vicia faba]